MQCPICNDDTFVVDSRKKDITVIRRRSCKMCGHRMTTIEIPLDDMGDIVQDVQAAILTVMTGAISKSEEQIRRVILKALDR